MSNSSNGSRPAVASTVRNGDVQLAVFEQGNPDGPTLVLVHGWPDTHRLWEHVVPLLADRFRVVSYDSRGAGQSTVPTAVADYRLELLASDLFAVIDAVSPDAPVHVLAHDWGSLESWEAVCAPGADRRIASLTSVSGWCFDHLGHWMRRNLTSPTPAGVGKVLAQFAASFYALLFHIPVLPALVTGRLLAPRWPRFLALFDGMDPALARPAATIGRDAANGVKRYRANTRDRLLRPRERRTEIPVQLIVNTRDKAVLPFGFEETQRWVADLRRAEIPAGHWAPLSHSADLARIAAGFVDSIENAAATDGSTVTA
ncbi:alpha/beta fold hydrolase [Rhodococcus spelaei]|uniref:Alpha/beta fold hydrolase n=1 Tax=Rhodococcus spelaei TaxID=2546320 RepID=A0A541BQV4_9NOCA|nr:alpha/beta fold hydrolase [Rhodococcus spelaei]TQF74703.1 alpha/beta fold hydrolase [Rhodococcus spelaei]